MSLIGRKSTRMQSAPAPPDTRPPDDETHPPPSQSALAVTAPAPIAPTRAAALANTQSAQPVAQFRTSGRSPSADGASAVAIPLLPATASATEQPEDGSASTSASAIETLAIETLARRMYRLEDVSAEEVSEQLLQVRTPAQKQLVDVYLQRFKLEGLTLEEALRAFLKRVAIVGETTCKDRLLGLFAQRYVACNPRGDDSSGPPELHEVGECHALAFALVMLNGELHANHNDAVRRRTREAFARDVRKVDGCEKLPDEYLKRLYKNLKERPLPVAQHQQPNGIASDRSSSRSTSRSSSSCAYANGNAGLQFVDKVNPLLVAPDFAAATEYKRGLLKRKAFRDQDGRRVAKSFFRRSWRTFFAVLLDSHLLLFKSELAYQQFRRAIDSAASYQRCASSTSNLSNSGTSNRSYRTHRPETRSLRSVAESPSRTPNPGAQLWMIPENGEAAGSPVELGDDEDSEYVVYSYLSSSTSVSIGRESDARSVYSARSGGTGRRDSASDASAAAPELFRLPHAFARAATSKKKAGGFLLQLVDSSEYLFRPATADPAECKLWISRINFVAALFSAPAITPLRVERCDSQKPESSRKAAAAQPQLVLTRPHFSALQVICAPNEQQRAHHTMCVSIAAAIEQLRASPPHRSASSRVHSDYADALEFLETQRSKFATYDELLRKYDRREHDAAASPHASGAHSDALLKQPSDSAHPQQSHSADDSAAFGAASPAASDCIPDSDSYRPLQPSVPAGGAATSASGQQQRQQKPAERQPLDGTAASAFAPSDGTLRQSTQ